MLCGPVAWLCATQSTFTTILGLVSGKLQDCGGVAGQHERVCLALRFVVDRVVAARVSSEAVLTALWKVSVYACRPPPASE